MLHTTNILTGELDANCPQQKDPSTSLDAGTGWNIFYRRPQSIGPRDVVLRHLSRGFQKPGSRERTT